MPVYLPATLPARLQCRNEGFAAEDERLCPSNALTIRLLNLMPEKERTERDFIRTLSLSPRPVRLTLLKIRGQHYKTTPEEHMNLYYRNFDELEKRPCSALIVTGAPIEHLPFEQVRYWQALSHIFSWARHHAGASLYICWGAQAALYHFYGIQKYPLAKKMFGVFPQKVLGGEENLLRGLTPAFPMPHSRHTEIRTADILKQESLELLAEGDISGASVIRSRHFNELFVTGHEEYEADTLGREYLRDKGKGLPIDIPRNYYPDDDASLPPLFSWREAARRFYNNWLEHCVKEI